MRFLSKLVSGFLSPLIGASLIVTHRSLRRLALLPFLITVFIFVFGLAAGLPFITSMVAPFTKALLGWLPLRPHSTGATVLSSVVPFLIWPALALALIYILLTITRLVASPLYGLLAERVLMKQGVLSEERIDTMRWVRRQARATRAALLKAALFLVLSVILALLSFIPGLGLFTSFAFLVLLAYDVVDYALEAMALSYEQRVDFFRQHFAVFLGLGAALGLVFLIPGLNFFVLPAAVAGGSDLVRRRIKRD
jgi:CysZ protein